MAEKKYVGEFGDNDELLNFLDDFFETDTAGCTTVLIDPILIEDESGAKGRGRKVTLIPQAGVFEYLEHSFQLGMMKNAGWSEKFRQEA